MSKIIKPDYDNSQLSIISSLKKYFLFNHKYKSDEILDKILMDKEFNHITLMILDGLGSSVLKDNLDENSILNIKHVSDLISIFPSTTAASTTSIISGLTPIETGWTGWQNYIEEIDKNVILFNGKNYFNQDEICELNGYDILPIKEFWSEFPVQSYKIFPSFDKENGVKNFKSGLKKLKNIWKNNEGSFTYFYWTEPDGIMHKYGCRSSKSHSVITSINDKLKKLYKKMDENSLIIVTADHGHIDVEPIDLTKDLVLYEMLNRNPSNDSRAMSFSVKTQFMDKFREYFNYKYSDYYKLYTKAEAINEGLFGDINRDSINSRIDSFIGDYFAVAISDKYFNYKENGDLMKSHHAGLTEREMIVPLILIYKE